MSGPTIIIGCGLRKEPGPFAKGDRASWETPAPVSRIHAQAAELLHPFPQSTLLLAGKDYLRVLTQATMTQNLKIERPFFDLAKRRFNDARQGYQVKLMNENHGRIPR